MSDEREQILDSLRDEWRKLLDYADEADDDGAHIGFARYYRIKADGLAEAIRIVRGK